MNMGKKLYTVGLKLAHCLGCHQRPDRSFFIHGKQFPLCARCTGVFVGECIGIILFRFIQPPIILLLSFIGMMFFDWFIQYIGILESKNSRRMITGTLCGYAYSTFVLNGLITLKALLQ